MKIDRFGEVFVVSDNGSSNGTILNGQLLKDPIALKNGDVLQLGGLNVTVVLKGDEPDEAEMPAADPELPSTTPGTPQAATGSQQPAAGGSGSMLLWVIIPVFGIVFLLFAGVILFILFSGPTTTVAKKQTDTSYTDDDPEPGTDNKKSSNKSGSETSNSGGTSSSPSTNTSNNDTPTSSGTPAANNSETAKIEQNGGTFLRNIVQNNPNAFLTTEQATKLSSKIKQLSSSSAVAANLAAAKKSSAEIKSLAQSKNLKPQFLAVAAIAKLGSSKGDVLQTAKGMADVLYKLGVSVGSERADDALVVIAIYEQGAAGDFLKMRNMLQDLANKSPESSRAIRTIWFLQKNGKISQAEYENALNFLAIGTIAQNPKDFGVNADPLGL
jgi:pSer/pThr/pTyr-binding forkhead associated (FHA) protein